MAIIIKKVLLQKCNHQSQNAVSLRYCLSAPNLAFYTGFVKVEQGSWTPHIRICQQRRLEDEEGICSFFSSKWGLLLSLQFLWTSPQCSLFTTEASTPFCSSSWIQLQVFPNVPYQLHGYCFSGKKQLTSNPSYKTLQAQFCLHQPSSYSLRRSLLFISADSSFKF